ncbi:MAG: portal protein [Planctomycetota bacterium]|nr:portal protein [Planctomycetota bacterium]
MTESQAILDVARECAALTDPPVLPPEGQTATSSLPESYQSIGSYAVLSMVGRMLSELYPPGFPWFQLSMRPEIRYNVQSDPEELRGLSEILMLTELQVQATLESSGIRPNDNSSPAGFLTQKVKSLRQLIVTGDTLERLDDDFRIRVYRRDQYVTKRDSRGDVLYHITREMVDPLSLTEDQQSASGLDIAKMRELPADKRMHPLYTSVDWQPESKVWHISQEIDGNVINESDEDVSPYFGTPFRLAPDEDYGRGHVELNIGNLRSNNTLEKRLLDIHSIMSKAVPVIDHGSPTREHHLTLETGVPIRAKVRDGKIQDIAFLGYGNIAEHRSLMDGIERKTRELAQAFLVESASSRDAERVTAFERRRNAQELNSAIGGVYPSISDSQHVPMLRRAIYVLNKKGILPSKKLDESIYEIRSLTGLTAIVRDQKAQSLLDLAQVAQALGPEALQQIDMGVLMETFLTYRSIYEPGLKLTPEQIAERQQAEQANQAQAAMVEAGANTAGQIAVEQVRQQGA